LRRRAAAAALALAAVTAHGGVSAPDCLAQTPSVEEKGPHGKQARFREFLAKVHAYDQLRAAARSGVPGAGKKATAEQIEKHRTALAEKIQEARKEAKPGDIFTPESQRAFRSAIENAHSGRRAAKIDRTIAQGEPVKLDLYVNKAYPEKIPITTVPPTFLQHFPNLPKKIEYRVVGGDLVLEDTEANLVIDIFPGAFPNAPPHN
jgi:hypothetical protein